MPPPIIRWHEDVVGKITNLGNLHTEILHLLLNTNHAKNLIDQPKLIPNLGSRPGPTQLNMTEHNP